MKIPKQLEDFLEEAAEHVTYMSCEEYEDVRTRRVKHVLVDVREKYEFDEGHIEASINIPRGRLEFMIDDVVPNKNTPVVIACGTGKRAALSAKTMVEMGYSDVRVLEGGYEGYCALPSA